MEPKIEIDIRDINESNLRDIPEPCKGCVYWEFPEEFEKGKKAEDSQKKAELEVKKRKWFEQTLKELGACGKVVYYNSTPVAYAQYASSSRFPNIRAYESEHVGKFEEGVVFLSCLYVTDQTMRRKGIGEMLLQKIIEDMRRLGFKAIETFARRDEDNNPSGPMAFYIRNGFHIKDNTNPEFPLMRFYL